MKSFARQVENVRVVMRLLVRVTVRRRVSTLFRRRVGSASLTRICVSLLLRHLLLVLLRLSGIGSYFPWVPLVLRWTQVIWALRLLCTTSSSSWTSMSLLREAQDRFNMSSSSWRLQRELLWLVPVLLLLINDVHVGHALTRTSNQVRLVDQRLLQVILVHLLVVWLECSTLTSKKQIVAVLIEQSLLPSVRSTCQVLLLRVMVPLTALHHHLVAVLHVSSHLLRGCWGRTGLANGSTTTTHLATCIVVSATAACLVIVIILHWMLGQTRRRCTDSSEVERLSR